MSFCRFRRKATAQSQDDSSISAGKLHEILFLLRESSRRQWTILNRF